MNLQAAIEAITDYFDLDALKFADYMSEDTIGGYHPTDPNRTFAYGPWEVEMQALYALVRIVKPLRVLEIGNVWGNSTTHIGTALRRNGFGRLTSIDITDDYLKTGVHQEFIDVATFHVCDVRHWCFEAYKDVTFVFDDANHTEEICSHIWRQFRTYMPSGAIIVSHDSEHFDKGYGVRSGIEKVVPRDDYLSLMIDPALCGLAMWKKP